MFVILLFCLLPSAIFAADLQDLVSASNYFEVEMIEHEQVLEQNPSATEPAASTLKYAKAKERDQDAEVSKAGPEFYCLDNVEDPFTRILIGWIRQ